MSLPRQAELLAPELDEDAPPPREKSHGKLDPEELFAEDCRRYRLPRFEQQYRFAESITFKGKDGRVRKRGWRFDFAFPDYKLAVEIEGLIVRKVWAAKFKGGGPVHSGGYVVNVLDVEPVTVAMGGHATPTGFREDALKYNTAAMLGWQVIRFLQNDIKPGHAIEMTQRVLASKGWKPQHT